MVTVVAMIVEEYTKYLNDIRINPLTEL